MKTIKFVGYLFYRYYSKGPRAGIPYFSTMGSMTLLGFMHLMQILILLNKVDLIQRNSTDDGLTKRIIIFFVMLPIYFLMTRLFKKSDIEPLKEKYDKHWDKVFSGNVWLIIYCILSFTLIIVLALWKKHQS
jgi:hypothetical protein